MIYFLLFFCIVLLVVVYSMYFVGKTPKKVNWIFVYSPIIFSSILLCGYMFNGPIKPLDLRKVEYTAIGMKYYNQWEIVGKNTIPIREMYTGIYKNNINDFDEFEIPKETYNYFKKLWKEKKELLVHEDEKNKVYFVEWNKNPEDALVYTKQELFVNYFKTYLGLYDFYEVSQKQAIDEKLYNRSRIDIVNSSNVLEPRQTLVYGLKLSDEESRSLSNVSSLDPEFRPILCVWVDSVLESSPEVIVKHQRSYWKGGKNNEVIFCIGINNPKEKKILWAYSFSWAIIPELEKYVIAESLNPGTLLDLRKYNNALISGFSKGMWRPRDFNSYTILGISITDFTVIISCVLIIIVNILISFRIGKKK